MNNGQQEFQKFGSSDDQLSVSDAAQYSPNSSLKRRNVPRNKNKTENHLNEQLILSDDVLSDSVGLQGSTSSHSSIDIEHKTLDNNAANFSQRSIHGHTTTSHAFWNLCKCFVGAASFALPWAVSKTGVVPAILGFVLLSLLAYLTFRWMLIASHYASNNHNPTYPELAEISFNRFFPLFNKNSNNDSNFIQMTVRRDDNNDNDNNDSDNSNSDINIYNTQNNKYRIHNYRCSKLAKWSVYTSMFLGMIGACGSYILFISGVISVWLSSFNWFSSSTFINTNYISILLLLPLPIIFSLIRSYRFLSSTAKFGVAGVVLALLVTMYDGILKINDGTINRDEIDNNVALFDLGGFPIFVGNACFLFIIHPMILSQEQSMIDRTRNTVSSQFKSANELSLFLVTLVNMIFSIFAYITFSDIIPFEDNIVDALDTGIIQEITRVCLCIDLLLTYALIMYPFTEALDTELFDITQLNSRGVIIKGNIIRIAIVLITAGIAICVPHFGYLTGLTGGSASVFMGFILPPIFIAKLAPDKVHKFELYCLCPLVFIFGCVMFIWSPYLILTQMYS